MDVVIAFLEGRTLQPIDRVVAAMQDAATRAEYELAARWREKFEQLEWLFGAIVRARMAVDLLTFVYRDPGTLGDDRAYVVRRGVVQATFPYPATRSSTRRSGAWSRRSWRGPSLPPGPLPVESIDELLLIMAWFRAHPEAFRGTTPLERWAS